MFKCKKSNISSRVYGVQSCGDVTRKGGGPAVDVAPDPLLGRRPAGQTKPTASLPLEETAGHTTATGPAACWRSCRAAIPRELWRRSKMRTPYKTLLLGEPTARLHSQAGGPDRRARVGAVHTWEVTSGNKPPKIPQNSHLNSI